MAGPPQYQSTRRWLPNMLDLDHLVQKVQDVQDIRQKMQQLQEELHERKNDEALQGSSQQSKLDPTKSEVQKLQTHIQQLEDNMKEMAKKRIQLLNECTDCLDQCQSRWISRLKEWRWEQQKAVIGHPFVNNLGPLQSWCEQLFEVNKNLREELELVGEPMSELQDRLVKLLKVLVQSSLVVNKQPPQVIEILSEFSTTVRCLLGEKVKPVVLKAKIINELQARDLDSGPSDDAGELLDNTAILEPDTTSTCATFRDMKIRRPDRRGSKPETEQKFALLFSTEIFIPGCDAPCRIQIISLPVVVISSSVQGCSARATIIWDCAFSEADRVPFMVPEQVPWSTMFNTLNSKFTSVVQTQHNLDQHDQHCLAEKIFNKPDCADDFSNMMVSWAQFNKELLPGRRFTFWEWFEGLMKLTKTHLRTYWSQGLIFGVTGKQKLHQILRNSPTGTFLLHFSDSEIGGITITYVSAIEEGEPRIQSTTALNATDLNICSLGGRILDIRHITHLYPDIPKDEVFKRFYSGAWTSQSVSLHPRISRTKKERPVGSHSTEALSPLKKYSGAAIPSDPYRSMDPSSQSSSSSERRKGNYRQISSSERLLDIRSSFIRGISGPVLRSLLDKLLEKTVLNDFERELADEIQNHRDKACFVIDTVRKKGEAASSEMIQFLCEVDPFLCEHKGEPKTQSIPPFSKRELDIRSLGNRISRISDLYPDIPEDEVFKRFYSETEPQTSLDYTSLPLVSGLSRDISSPTPSWLWKELDISGTKKERPVGSHSTEALSPLKKYSGAAITTDPHRSMDPSSQSSSSSKRRMFPFLPFPVFPTFRFYRSSRKKKYKEASSTVASSIDLHDTMLDQPPPVTLPETEMIINQAPAADASTGFSQDNTREMDLHETAGPSTLQLSTSDDDDSDSAAFYDKTKEKPFPPSPVTDYSSHPPSREETDDDGSSFDNSSSTFSRSSCSQSTAPTVCGPPCPQDSPVVPQDSNVCTEGSTAQDAFEPLPVQSEGESGDVSDAPVNMETSDTALNYSVTNNQSAHSHLQLSSSDPGWTESDSSCLSRSHSVPSLSQTTSPENKTCTRSQSLPDLLLKSSFEEFTPDISVDEDDETYWFQCSCPGLYQCSVTGLVFHMEGEGDVVYRTVPWDRRLLAQHHKNPAGPLFDIKCLQQSVCQLHLPHCEIRSTGGCEFLSVAHVNDEGIEFIVPQKITETHVIINITGFSAFGNVKDEDSPPDPVQALVLLFYRPPAHPNLTSLLNVLLLPRNVELQKVVRTRKKLVGDEIYVETISDCKLCPKQEYTLSTCPEDDSLLVKPNKAEFYCDNYDNYIPSFKVKLKTIRLNINLVLRDTNSSSTVWEDEVDLLSTGVKRSCQQGSSSERLLDIRSSFINGISGPVLKSLLDKLLEKTVITDPERESADVIQDKGDKARFVIDTVRKKGEAASTEMIEFLCEIDRFLCEHLGLI